MNTNKLPDRKMLDMLSSRMATQFQLPAVYDDALSYQGLIYKLMQYIQDTIQNVSDWNDWLENFVATFDTKLQDTVRDKIQEWVDNGTIQVIVSETLQWELDSYKLANEQDKQDILSNLDAHNTKNEQDKTAMLNKIDAGLLLKRDKATKITSFDLDTSSNAYKIQPLNISDEVKSMMAGTTPITSSVPVGGVVTESYADNSITEPKLGYIPQVMIQDNFKKTFTSDDITSYDSGMVISLKKQHGDNSGIWLYNSDGTIKQAYMLYDDIDYTLANNQVLIWDIVANTITVQDESLIRPDKYVLLAYIFMGVLIDGYWTTAYLNNIAKIGKDKATALNYNNSIYVYTPDNSYSYFEENPWINENKIYFYIPALNARNQGYGNTISWALMKEQLAEKIPEISPLGHPDCLSLEDGEALAYDLTTTEAIIVPWHGIDASKHFVLLYNVDGRIRGGYLAIEYFHTKIKTLRGLIDDLSNTSQTDAVPSYWKAHIQEKINRIRNLQSSGVNSTSFGFITDIHWSDNAQNSFALMESIIKDCDIKYFINGGDFVNNNLTTTKLQALTQIRDMMKMSRPIKDKMLNVLGNHDDNSLQGSYDDTITNDELYSEAFRYLDDSKELGGDGTYYFVDDRQMKIRYIILNCIDIPYDTSLTYKGQHVYAIRQAQINWLSSVALNVPTEEWSVVVSSHVPLIREGITGTDAFVRNDDLVLSILSAFKNKTSFNGSSIPSVENDFKVNVNVDYTAKGGNVICVISGHAHWDNIAVSNGINIVTTLHDSLYRWSSEPLKTTGTITEHAFDILTINKNTRVVNLTRIGAGTDRSFTY